MSRTMRRFLLCYQESKNTQNNEEDCFLLYSSKKMMTRIKVADISQSVSNFFIGDWHETKK